MDIELIFGSKISPISFGCGLLVSSILFPNALFRSWTKEKPLFGPTTPPPSSSELLPLDASRALHGEARASYWVEFTAEVVEALPPDGAEGRARLLLFAKSSFC